MKQTPAQVVYEELGGQRAVGRILGLHHSTVGAWDKPKAQKGRDGRVPDEYHRQLLAAAKRLRKTLTPEDLVNGRVASSQKRS